MLGGFGKTSRQTGNSSGETGDMSRRIASLMKQIGDRLHQTGELMKWMGDRLHEVANLSGGSGLMQGWIAVMFWLLGNVSAKIVEVLNRLSGVVRSFFMPFDQILQEIQTKIRQEKYVVTLHADEEMEDDQLSIFDVECCILAGEILER
jgi:hypothetical protein